MSARGLGNEGSSVMTRRLPCFSVCPTLLVQEISNMPASSKVASLMDQSIGCLQPILFNLGGEPLEIFVLRIDLHCLSLTTFFRSRPWALCTKHHRRRGMPWP